jgi:hypothetical protein
MFDPWPHSIVTESYELRPASAVKLANPSSASLPAARLYNRATRVVREASVPYGRDNGNPLRNR